VTVKTILSACAALLFVTACGEPDVILPGERFAVGDDGNTANEVRDIALPAMVANANWTHRNGGPDHRTQHPALGADLSQLFAVQIGEGETAGARITADPVVNDGVIYTLDARSRVTATRTNGAQVWAVSVLPGNANPTSASGGGIAVSNGRVFVTTGFGELTALDARTGGALWTQDLDAPGGSSPTVVGDLVYLVSRNSVGWALDVTNGRIRWQLDGIPSLAGFGGGAGVAVEGDLAVFPFPSGQVVAAFPQGGLQRWSTVVTGQRRGSAAAVISDISGDPVIDGNRVYVGNFAGSVVALESFTGERIWTANEGAVSPVWPTGNAVFLVNDLSELVRLDASDGSVVWRVQLPEFTTERGLFRESVTRYAHYGPVLAGGRLIVPGSDGVIRQFDPRSGSLVGSVAVPGGAASNPVVAGRTLYVVSKTGNLVAFR